ncbi:hypothetical protein [uncultured Endozoicomonas sp.]|uniref:hypothetical protein n=1 Tax=uncultured Endozoicomonas sp. TaxID=432652 RepID=UPI00260FA09A|nr:hypothetical protein [uncultured Endozoicomonas sp.]
MSFPANTPPLMDRGFSLLRSESTDSSESGGRLSPIQAEPTGEAFACRKAAVLEAFRILKPVSEDAPIRKAIKAMRITENPAHPNYSTRESRDASFPDGFSNFFLGNIDQWTESGAFYIGPDDAMKCFYCGGGFYEIESEDYAYACHAGLYPNCGYMQELLGPSTVRAVNYLTPSVAPYTRFPPPNPDNAVDYDNLDIRVARYLAAEPNIRHKMNSNVTDTLIETFKTDNETIDQVEERIDTLERLAASEQVDCSEWTAETAGIKYTEAFW